MPRRIRQSGDGASQCFSLAIPVSHPSRKPPFGQTAIVISTTHSPALVQQARFSACQTIEDVLIFFRTVRYGLKDETPLVVASADCRRRFLVVLSSRRRNECRVFVPMKDPRCRGGHREAGGKGKARCRRARLSWARSGVARVPLRGVSTGLWTCEYEPRAGLVLEEGMVLGNTIELLNPMWKPDVGCVFGDMMVVRESGAQELCQYAAGGATNRLRCFS